MLLFFSMKPAGKQNHFNLQTSGCEESHWNFQLQTYMLSHVYLYTNTHTLEYNNNNILPHTHECTQSFEQLDMRNMHIVKLVLNSEKIKL